LTVRVSAPELGADAEADADCSAEADGEGCEDADGDESFDEFPFPQAETRSNKASNPIQAKIPCLLTVSRTMNETPLDKKMMIMRIFINYNEREFLCT
jgi:hypothetical protein